MTPTTAPTSATTWAAAVCIGAAPGEELLDAAWPLAPPDELPAAVLLDTGGGGAGTEELEGGAKLNVCPFTTTAPLLPSLIYSPAINCAGAPGTSVFPSTAYVCEISVTVNTAPSAVKTASSVPVTGALVIVLVVLFMCVNVLWTGGPLASASAARRRSSCQLSLPLSLCSPPSS